MLIAQLRSADGIAGSADHATADPHGGGAAAVPASETGPHGGSYPFSRTKCPRSIHPRRRRLFPSSEVCWPVSPEAGLISRWPADWPLSSRVDRSHGFTLLELSTASLIADPIYERRSPGLHFYCLENAGFDVLVGGEISGIAATSRPRRYLWHSIQLNVTFA